MISTSESGHRAFGSPVEAESIGRAMLCDSRATESQLLETAAAIRGTSVGGHNRAARMRRVADDLESRAHRRMTLRAVRAAVRDHARRDPYAVPLGDLLEPISPHECGPDCAHLVMLRERLDAIGFARGGQLGPNFPEQSRRTVRDAIRDAKVEGRATELDSGYERHRDEIVISVRYAETWLATYAVAPDSRAVCWMD